MQANISAAHNLGSAPGGVICQRTLDWGEPLPEWFQREVIEQDGPQPARRKTFAILLRPLVADLQGVWTSSLGRT